MKSYHIMIGVFLVGLGLMVGTWVLPDPVLSYGDETRPAAIRDSLYERLCAATIDSLNERVEWWANLLCMSGKILPPKSDPCSGMVSVWALDTWVRDRMDVYPRGNDSLGWLAQFDGHAWWGFLDSLRGK